MFKTLMLSALLPCLSGGLTQNQSSSLSKDFDSYTITLSAEDVTSELQHFYDGYLDTINDDNVLYLHYGGYDYYFSEVIDGSVSFGDIEGQGLYIDFVFDNSIYGDGSNYYFYTTSPLELLDGELKIVFFTGIDLETFNEVYALIQSDVNTQPPYTNILQEIITILVSGITGIATGLGNGVSQLVSSIFITEGNLSVFGGVIVVFAGLGLAVGLSRWVMNFLTSLGKKD